MISHADVLNSWFTAGCPTEEKSIAYQLPFTTYQVSILKVTILANLTGEDMLRKPSASQMTP